MMVKERMEELDDKGKEKKETWKNFLKFQQYC